MGFIVHILLGDLCGWSLHLGRGPGAHGEKTSKEGVMLFRAASKEGYQSTAVWKPGEGPFLLGELQVLSLLKRQHIVIKTW